MLKSFLRLMVFTAICTVSAHAQNVIRYVKPAADGLGDGTSWANASGDLQAMIDGQGVTQVWVAAGTYKPVRPADNMSINSRDKAFVMKANVKIYGGFPATGSPLMSDRDLETYTSLLSGDLDNDDTISTKDAYHVLIAAGNVGSAILEGFTISGGNANVVDKTSADTLQGRTLLVNNKAIVTNHGGGIAIFDASPVLSHIKVTGNSAALLGGGMCLTSSSPTISFSEISGNNAPQSGGGVANLQSNPTFSYSTISGNTSAGKGGGVFNVGSAPVFVSALLIGNFTVYRGGAMYNESGSNPTLTNLTISGNFAGGDAGGIYNADSSSPVIRNSVITGNSTGVTTSATLNYVNSMIQGLSSSDNGNLPDSDPYFKGAPAYAPAPFTTGNYQLERCSPLINNGDNALLDGTTTDFAGNPRITHWTVDIGALEYQGSLAATEIGYVKPVASGTGDGLSWANASGDLQQMINKTCVREVWVAAGTYKPIHPANNSSATDAGNRDNAFVMKADVKVYGGFPDTGSPVMSDRNSAIHVSLLSGDLDHSGSINDVDAHHVLIVSGDLGTAVLDGFTISGGNATDNIPNRSILVNNKGILSNRAGGIAIFESSPELSHIKVIGNKALSGGGINIINAAPGISFVEISGNQSTAGGGGVGIESCNPSFLNMTISNNTSNYGGGIYNYQGAPSFGNTLITGNHAAIYGGAIYNRSGLNPILTNVTISGNASDDQGGGIYNVETASPIIRNSVISGNSSGVVTTGTLDYANSLIQGLTSTENGNVADSDPLFQGALSYVSAPFPAGNYQLEPCSPLLNKGDNAQLSGIITDLAGNPRIHNTTVDIGALEFQGNTSSSEMRYVKPFASGTGDGTSWQNASDDIQLMINAPCVQEIWVAKGRYKPKRRADNLSEINDINSNNAFVLKKDLKLYGGFNGTETTLSERVLSLAGRSMLSGDLDDSNTQTNADAYHVVICLGDAGSGAIDGFIITQGKAGHGNNPMTVKGEVIPSDRGAGVFISRSSPLIANISVVENVSIAGGAGIYNSESSPEINNCLISSNFATGFDSYGGGILNTNSSSPRIIATIISGNGTGDVGGGISNVFSSSPTIINSLITGNRAGGTRGGGALSIEVNSSPNLINTTISGNASSGGTIYSNYAYTVRNSIIWGNETGLSGTEPTYFNSLIQGKTSVTQGNIAGTSNPYFRNALGFALAPSTAGDFRLWAESPAINQGDNNAISGHTTDFDGASRIFNNVVDMGAHEYQGGQFPILYVKEGGTGGGTSWQDASGDIQSALNAPQPHEVWVAGGVYKPNRSAEDPKTTTPGDRKNAFVTQKDVKIYGGFAGTETSLAERNLSLPANRSVLSGDLDNSNSLTDGDASHVVISMGDMGTAVLDGFTITGGNANATGNAILVNESYVDQSYGGGIYNQSNLSLLKNVIVRGNSAVLYGGGIYNNSATAALSITNSAISGNTSILYGGGIYNLSSSLTIINTVLSGNQAVLGAGLCNSAASPKIVNTTITANKSTNSGAGGAIFNFGDATSSSPVIQNTIIWGNSGGVFGGSPVFTHSVVQGSSSATDGNIPDSDPQFMGGISFSSAPNAAGDFRIAACSPLVDKGSNTFLGGVLADFAGNNRFFNTTTDIGAYENQGEGSFSVRYVKPEASGTGDGTSWANASGDLQAMIQAPCVQELWLAGGVYKPNRRADVPETMTPGDRNNAFVMRKNVKIYGGFAGTESALSERNLTISANRTVLSGDFNSNNNVDDADAYHVVVAAGELGDAWVDGLTISGGNANGPDEGQILANNTAVYQFKGAGLYSINTSVSIRNVFVQGNKASYQGGGIYAENGVLNMTNAVVAGNRSDGAGGGIYNLSGSATLTNVTLSGNQGGAISNNNATATIANSVVYGNSNELTDDGFTISYSMIQGSSSTANHNIADTSPRFANAPLAGTAPFTNGDYRLLSCSPLLNHGNNALLTSITKDIAGNPRIYGATTDIGAFELQLDGSTASGIRYVKAGILTGTKDGSSWENASDDLQAMLNDFCASEVWVAGGVYKPVRPANDLWTIDPANRANAFVLTTNVKLYGGFAGTETTLAQRDLAITVNKSVLSGDLDGSGSINDNDSYHVVLSAGDVGTGGIDGFTITGGHANGTSGQSIQVNNRAFSAFHGAGMSLHFSSPVISNVTVTGNMTQTNDLGLGGGMYINNSSPVLHYTTISNNVSRSGAGVFSTGAASSPQFFNCRISGNVGEGSGNVGGGICNVRAMRLVNCQVTGNSVAGNGAGIALVQQGSLVAINIVISGNKSASGTGSFLISGNNAAIEFVNSVVWGNSGSHLGTNYTYRNSLIQGFTSSENGNVADTDPEFKTPLDFANAPSTAGDFSLLNCSPLINMGTTDTTGLYLPLMDLAGNARIAFDRIDMGSFENSHTPVSSIASNTSIVLNMQKTDGTIQYYNHCNELVATLNGTNDAASVSGSTVAKVWIETSQSSAYVKRHYEITPSNPEGSGIVTIYFTNQEFKDFNAASPANLLPDANEPATIASRTSHVILEKLSGTSSNGTGLPASYTAGTSNITPSSVVWNGSLGRWEITFSTTGFSGFFLKTNATPLPVSWISFTSELNMENQAVLNWKVNETQVKRYELQRSQDATHFESIGTLDGKGDGINSYQFTDINPLLSSTYYRIKQTDYDGSTSHSRIIVVRPKSLFSFYPNPVTDVVTITVDQDQVGTKVTVIAANGSVIKQQTIRSQSFSIDVSGLPEGIYLVRTQNGHSVKLVKE